MPAIRLIKHEVIPSCGSFEARFPDGAPSRFFYWDDAPARRLRPDLVDGETASEQAKACAQAEHEEGKTMVWRPFEQKAPPNEVRQNPL